MRYDTTMKKSFIIRGIAIGAAIAFTGTALAFTEPTALPPLNNAPSPITVGSGRQVKAGDLTVSNLKATSITLGEETRTSWLDAASSCGWTGWKCDCKSDGSSAAGLALTVGVQCSGGQLAGVKVVSLQISSKAKSCGATAPAPCAQALYTRQNAGGDAGDTFLGTAGNVIKSIVCFGGLFC